MPIADAHFHLMLFMAPEELRDRMARHNIRWVVSSGAQGSPRELPARRDAAVHQLLGDRFLQGVGGMELRLAERDLGRRFFDDPSNARRDEVLQQIDTELGKGGRVIVETFPNAETSSADPMRRRRLDTDGPFFRTALQIAARHRVPLGMHLEYHPRSIEQLETLIASQPEADVQLMHCGKTTTAAQMRPLLARYPRLYCDLAFRSPPQAAAESRQDPHRTIFWGESFFMKAGIKPDWKALIEEFPDRFMVAIDDVHSWNDYDGVVASIRQGLLAQLKPETAEKVAWRNAVRLFRLPEN